DAFDVPVAEPHGRQRKRSAAWRREGGARKRSSPPAIRTKPGLAPAVHGFAGGCDKERRSFCNGREVGARGGCIEACARGQRQAGHGGREGAKHAAPRCLVGWFWVA